MDRTPNPEGKQAMEEGLRRKLKTLEFREMSIKKGLTEPNRYGKISPHQRTRTSTHDAIEYSIGDSKFQLKFWKLALFTGKMPWKWSEIVRFLFKLYKSKLFLRFVRGFLEQNFLNEQAFVTTSDQRRCRQRSRFVWKILILCLRDSSFRMCKK